MNVIVGLSYSYHDAAVAIISESTGDILYAAQEELFTRVKHDPVIPSNALKFGICDQKIKPSDIMAIGFFENEDIKLRRKILFRCKEIQNQTENDWPIDYKESSLRCNLHITKEIINLLSEIYPRSKDRVKSIPIHFSSHHYSHALTAAKMSGFSDSLVISIDAVGEMQTVTSYNWKEGRLELDTSIDLPISLGLYYSAITNFLGFAVNEGEYKVMGLSSYGKPKYLEQLRKVFSLNDLRSLNYFQFEKLESSNRLFGPKLVEYLGLSPASNSKWAQNIRDGDNPLSELSDNEANYVDLACSVQRHYEEMLITLVSTMLKRSNVSSICLTGGCALNSLANQKLHELVPLPFYMHHSPGDAGSAIGAALHAQEMTSSKKISSIQNSLYTGPSYTDENIEQAMTSYGELIVVNKSESKKELVYKCSKMLNHKKVIGIFNSNHEWGPRALGNRSIIADPSYGDMKDIVNTKIKFREPYRPFAPIALEQYAQKYFNLRAKIHKNDPYYAMIETCNVTEEGKLKFPSISHRDETARIQLIPANSNLLIKEVLERHYQMYSRPVLLNTSFNLKGEPVVCTPNDALRTFVMSGMDALLINSFLITKR
ncbi:Decarbamoylnovobiocin carbamoyltransferase [Prochlorococcus marinus str. MIT 1342]|nr:Decarbamoylnovobiocin carbamoyltransferase [Prochlorococcus marinus str. MIT 1342]